MTPVRAADGLAALLDRHIERGAFPGAVALVGVAGEVAALCARGQSVLEPEVHEAVPDTLFDLGELTGALVAAPLALLLQELEGLDLDARVGRFVPELDSMDKREITLRDLLLHRAGFPAWMPLYAHGGEMPHYLRALSERPPAYKPGARVVDSSPGTIVLGEALARAAAAPLDRLAAELLFGPLGASTLGYGPRPAAERPRVAATERGDGFESRRARAETAGYNGWRRGMIWGEVHDHNAWALGGVSGHAGLFGSAPDLWKFALEILELGRGALPGGVARQMREDGTPERPEGRTPGWRLARTPGGSADPALPPDAIGQAGFTGTSLWIDPRARRVLILLTNRVHPEVRDLDMDAVRREFHQVAAALR